MVQTKDELPDQEGGAVELPLLAGVGRESYGLGVGLRVTQSTIGLCILSTN